MTTLAPPPAVGALNHLFLCRQWHGCPLSFGVMEHLQHHVIGDHAGAGVQTPFKCRWKNCEDFFCARSSSKQVPEGSVHTPMQRCVAGAC